MPLWKESFNVPYNSNADIQPEMAGRVTSTAVKFGFEIRRENKYNTDKFDSHMLMS